MSQNLSKQWAYNYKTNDLFVCERNCDKKHEHFIGTYEKALKYFIGSEIQEKEENEKHDLYNIIIFHQLSETVMTKTSAELYDILITASSTKKYWIQEQNRHVTVMNLLDKAKEHKMIHDQEIIGECNKDGAPKRMLNRLYRYNKWLEMLEYK